jgi:hypothetical protein
MIEQRIEHVHRHARGGGDQLGVERPIAIQEMRVDLEARSLAVMRVQAPGIAAKAGSASNNAVSGVTYGPERGGTFAKRSPSPSDIVGCARIASLSFG